jgi:hypothetical protein
MKTLHNEMLIFGVLGNRKNVAGNISFQTIALGLFCPHFNKCGYVLRLFV